MHNKYFVYPYGYLAFQPSGVRLTGRSEGDMEVAELYRTYFLRNDESKTWEFKVAVMAAAQRLFGPNLYDWALSQLNNGYLNNKAVQFIADTVKFVEYGYRDMPTILWSDVLDPKPYEDKIPSTLLRTELRAQLKSLLAGSDDSYLYKWLQQANGFEDLVVSLSIFFGPDRHPEDHNTIVNQSPKNPQMQRLQKLLNF